jgi:hypothetical protein
VWDSLRRLRASVDTAEPENPQRAVEEARRTNAKVVTGDSWAAGASAVQLQAGIERYRAERSATRDASPADRRAERTAAVGQQLREAAIRNAAAFRRGS